jgi:hypothetical protein
MEEYGLMVCESTMLRRVEWGDIAGVKEMKIEYKRYKSTLGRPGHRWTNNIKMYCKETRWEVVNWIHLAQERDSFRVLVNKETNLSVPYTAGNFLTI